MFFRYVLVALVALWLSGCGKDVGVRGSLGGGKSPGETPSESSRYRSPRNDGEFRKHSRRKPAPDTAKVDLHLVRNAELAEDVTRSFGEDQKICVRSKGRLVVGTKVSIYSGDCGSLKKDSVSAIELFVGAPVPGLVTNSPKKKYVLVLRQSSGDLPVGVIEENFVGNVRSVLKAEPSSLSYSVLQLCTAEFACKIEFDGDNRVTSITRK